MKTQFKLGIEVVVIIIIIIITHNQNKQPTLATEFLYVELSAFSVSEKN